jgi:hypothetical protein
LLACFGAEETRSWLQKSAGGPPVRTTWAVYGDQDELGHEIAEWDVDVHVEEHEVQPARHQRRRR